MKVFSSPDELRKYSLALASEMMVAGYKEQSRILEFQANMVCTTGWEYLGELLEGVYQVRAIGNLPDELEQKLKIIYKTSKSKTPYTYMLNDR